ncbi:hypothetical protein CI1B_78410 [Bradyrhizobium ivorense]|uniref:Uncharacterized protein n=1 Tax=Bradyrhizobium ivorense TaxID=2511166 RepID=A0A508TZ52_9BRAD|nr:hypothetical protein [Bradyrhizobium ivorense]VIO77619.1 hypothetical protein CI41S_58750 [Bradyrhizobium ivorense]VIO79508.1 hypothetical protein CI1B_78410 [Bradyrhizobium ivorense]
MNPGYRIRAIVVASTILVLPDCAHAFELTGAWATSADQCGKVFIRKGRANQVTFRNLSGVYGKGFIVEADRLRGKFEICAIKSRKDEGQTINIIVGCAQGIMMSNVQFFLKTVDDNTITRQFPGVEGMDATYYRCKI